MSLSTDRLGAHCQGARRIAPTDTGICARWLIFFTNMLGADGV
jgi:hypothetical protein